jgi:hypothetical protein
LRPQSDVAAWEGSPAADWPSPLSEPPAAERGCGALIQSNRLFISGRPLPAAAAFLLFSFSLLLGFSSLPFFQFPFPISLLLEATRPAASVASLLLSLPRRLSLFLVCSSFRFLFSFIFRLGVAFASFFSRRHFCLFFLLLLFSFVFHFSFPCFWALL